MISSERIKPILLRQIAFAFGFAGSEFSIFRHIHERVKLCFFFAPMFSRWGFEE
jgi:hypothetical protein